MSDFLPGGIRELTMRDDEKALRAFFLSARCLHLAPAKRLTSGPVGLIDRRRDTRKPEGLFYDWQLRAMDIGKNFSDRSMCGVWAVSRHALASAIR